MARRPVRRPRKALKPAAQAEVQSQAEPLVQASAMTRESLRPALREEDPRSRAAARAAEIRDHGGELESGEDKYFIAPSDIPQDWDYQWKRVSTLGKQDPSYEVNVARSGWSAVPADRHPQLMPRNWSGGTIERDGLVLMERPKVISDEARARELRDARNQVRQKEEQLAGAPPGQFERQNKDQSMAKVSKSYEHVPIPD